MTKYLANIKRFHARISQSCGRDGGQTQTGGLGYKGRRETQGGVS